MTTDYHEFCFRGTPKEKRTRLNIGDIYVNGATCHMCDWFIRSRNKHDYVSCRCGNVSVDGGSWYAKRNFKTDAFTNVIEYFDDVEEST